MTRVESYSCVMICDTLSVRSVILVPFEEGSGVLLLLAFALHSSRNDAGKQRGSRVRLAIVQHLRSQEIEIVIQVVQESMTVCRRIENF